jgi:Ca2+-binding EF-hand superfamily protein
MNRTLSGLGVGACLLAGLVLTLAPLRSVLRASPQADPPKERAQASKPSAAQDLAFLGGGRPVLLRIHVTVDGKPLAAARDRYVKQWLDFLDRDGDGVLSADEARYVPSPQALRQMRFNGVPVLVAKGGFASMAELDADGDGKVTMAELVAHFERAGFRPIELLEAGPQRNVFDAPSEILFQQLDVKKQGKLSREGVRRAADMLLRKFDANDDELISADELMFSTRTAGGFGVAQVLPGGRPKGGPAQGSFLAVRPGERERQLGLRLVALLDRDKDFKLSRAESGMDKETFDRLDTDRNGFLDEDELAVWHQRAPDVELTVRLGTRAFGRARVELSRGGDKAGAETPEGVRLTFGDAQISVHADDTRLQPRLLVGRALIQQFRLADIDNKGYLKVGDPNVRARVIQQLLPVADRDRDGKVTLAEMTALANLLELAPAALVNLTAAEQGRTLFQLLDTNRDGQLSLYELRTAWDRLAPLDKDGDGFVSKEEIPRQYELTVGQGSSRFGARQVVAGRLQPALGPRPVPQRGPLWFRKMDLNGDGFVSPREFLGTAEDFRRIDADGDGLISPEEAERHDAALRAKTAPGR